MRAKWTILALAAALAALGCDNGSPRGGVTGPSAPSSNQAPQGNVGGEGRAPEAAVPKGNTTSPNPTSRVP